MRAETNALLGAIVTDLTTSGYPVSVEEVCAAAHAPPDGIVDAGFHATGTATIWPQCPRHPGTHPLTPRTQDGEVVVWACLRTGEVVCPLGELAGVFARPGDAPD